LRIVGVVDQEQPIVALSFQPAKCILGGRSCRGSSSDSFQTRMDGFEAAGVDKIDSPESR
jgi:hypothetical protein